MSITVGSDGWRLQPFREPVFVGQGFAGRPGRALAQRRQRDLGASLGLADHAREIAVAHDGDQAGNGARGIFLQTGEIGGRHLRAQHAAVQHSRQRGIVDEPRMGENLVGNVQPLNRIAGHRALCRWLRHGAGRRVAIQRDPVGEFPIARPDIAGPGDRAVLDFERVGPDAELIGRRGEKDLADFRAGLPDGAAGLLHRKTARGDAFVGAARRRGADHLHPADIDIEFVGGDLGECRHDALADLHLSRRDHHLSLGREPDPRRQHRVGREADGQFRGGGGGGTCHDAAISAAARNTARTIRLCEPQRQRLRSSAAFTCVLEGFGFCINSAAALIRMPETQ